MIYLVPIIIFVLSLAVDTFVETTAEISSDSLLDNDAGVAIQPVIITPDGVIDMRPEAAMPQREPHASSLRDAIGI